MEKVSIIKHIIQHLNQNGLKDVSSTLEKESNISLESEAIKLIKANIIEGKIDFALEVILKLMEVNNEKSENTVLNQNTAVNIFIFNRLVIHKIFKLVEEGKMEEALLTIRSHTGEENNSDNPIKIDQEGLKKIKNCISLIFSYTDSNSLKSKMSKICPEALTSESLITYIDRLILMKETNGLGDNNLQQILQTVMTNQVKNCKYHNTTENKFSYFFDHKCKKENIPYKPALSIEQHNEEIVNIAYSYSFKYFAAIIKGNSAIAIYEINKYMDYMSTTPRNINSVDLNLDNYTKKTSVELSLINTIQSPHDGLITSLQWSKKDKLLMTASKDKSIKLFDPFTGVCKLTLSGHDGMVSSAVFLNDDSKVISSGLDYKITLWDLKASRGSEKEFSVSIPNVTVSELLYSERIKILIVISATTNSILFFDIDTKSELEQMRIPMNDVIVSSAISKLDNGAYLLVNSSKATPVLNLFNLKTNPPTNERKFFGHRQERFNNKCNFGGEAENFLLCGSEDGKVCVWSRNHSIPILSIKTHSAPVNAVICSHSHLTDLIISCSEDHTIKILTNDNVDKVTLLSGNNGSLFRKYSLEQKIVNPDENSNNNLSSLNAPNSISLTRSVANMLGRISNIFGGTLNEINNPASQFESDEEM